MGCQSPVRADKCQAHPGMLLVGFCLVNALELSYFPKVTSTVTLEKLPASTSLKNPILWQGLRFLSRSFLSLGPDWGHLGLTQQDSLTEILRNLGCLVLSLQEGPIISGKATQNESFTVFLHWTSRALKSHWIDNPSKDLCVLPVFPTGRCFFFFWVYNIPFSLKWLFFLVWNICTCFTIILVVALEIQHVYTSFQNLILVDHFTLLWNNEMTLKHFAVF